MRVAIGQDRQDVGHALRLHLFSAHGRIGAADAREKDAQVVIDFRGGRHRRARVLDVHFLLDGDGRRDALDAVHVRLGHAAQELAGIGGEAFGETALSLGKERVERQGALSAAAHAGHDDETVTGNLHRNLL